MTFQEFEKAWNENLIQQKYSYAVEQDHQSWEAAVIDISALEDLKAWMV